MTTDLVPRRRLKRRWLPTAPHTSPRNRLTKGTKRCVPFPADAVKHVLCESQCGGEGGSRRGVCAKPAHPQSWIPWETRDPGSFLPGSDPSTDVWKSRFGTIGTELEGLAGREGSGRWNRDLWHPVSLCDFIVSALVFIPAGSKLGVVPTRKA